MNNKLIIQDCAKLSFRIWKELRTYTGDIIDNKACDQIYDLLSEHLAYHLRNNLCRKIGKVV